MTRYTQLRLQMTPHLVAGVEARAAQHASRKTAPMATSAIRPSPRAASRSSDSRRAGAVVGLAAGDGGDGGCGGGELPLIRFAIHLR
eukprot:scaffold8382_cov70-Phaeocystis_antarctica.AAC.9